MTRTQIVIMIADSLTPANASRTVREWHDENRWAPKNVRLLLVLLDLVTPTLGQRRNDFVFA